MEGIGNDYVYINGFVEQIQDPHVLAKKISDRHFGVGSDGLVLVLPSAVSDLRMRMFNADGTEAEMCGNAARCVGKFAFDHGLIKKDLLRLETLAGEKVIRLAFEGGTPCGATVDMGEPVLVPELVPVSLGNRENCIAQALVICMKLPRFQWATLMPSFSCRILKISRLPQSVRSLKMTRFFPDGQIQNLCRFYRGTESGCAYGKEGPEKLLPAARELARR